MKIHAKDGSLSARRTTVPMDSSPPAEGSALGARINSTASMDTRMKPANARNTDCQGIWLISTWATGGPHDLAGRARRRGDPQCHGTVPGRCGTADHRQDNAKARAGNTESYQDLKPLVLAGGGGVGRQ